MPRSAYFYQDCPTCGRVLQIRVEYLGRKLVCQHCRGEFEVVDPGEENEVVPSTTALLDRANELLATVDVQKPQFS